MHKNLVVLISGSGTNLQAIIEAIEANRINGRISLVISNKADAYGLTRAEQHGIATRYIDHKAFDDREAYDAKLKEVIDDAAPDFIVLAGYMRIMTPSLVEHFSGKMVNIHPSLLPKYKGLHTHQRAIDAGDTEHGLSVHFVTPELDGGPVIIQSKVPVFTDDDATILAERVQTQERQIYPLVVSWLCDGRLVMRDNRAVMDNDVLPPQGFAHE
ncbi:phosphoribosylglycinamide formyltransferase [Alteromonas sediminis]|uniref:Phosphoribosylglycinamide formyltransferase n=1 Tax=Alteromonas sediminis TaxID=2259342 RepID=A0A3N5Y1G3_9ALTE|nr:phosphoribosylglycinamide formyltransferase [Alteromonas sediminis]RPJ67472.1 phosphoribosylglycinamide formyltransferase [Alteromonas sediminis]